MQQTCMGSEFASHSRFEAVIFRNCRFYCFQYNFKELSQEDYSPPSEGGSAEVLHGFGLRLYSTNMGHNDHLFGKRSLHVSYRVAR
jgi:hypothetical protein